MRYVYVVGCCGGPCIGMAASDRGWVTVASGKYLVFAREVDALKWAIQKLGTRCEWFILEVEAALVPVGPRSSW